MQKDVGQRRLYQFFGVGVVARDRRRHRRRRGLVSVPETATGAHRQRLVRAQSELFADLPDAAAERKGPAHARRYRPFAQGQSLSFFIRIVINITHYNYSYSVIIH